MIAVIPTGPVATRILKHVGLPAQAEDFASIRRPPEAFELVDDGWGDFANVDAA